MRILYVHTAAEVSISDVSRGYRSALERAGHDVRDYSMRARMEYHYKSLPEEVRNNTDLLARQASETILNEAIYHDAELVIIVSGLNVHPICLWLLGKVNMRVAVILTESPYDDEYQGQWIDLSKVDSTVDITVFTNDSFSAETFGWHLLPPAYDKTIHKPGLFSEEEACDVLMVGTGWDERRMFLEAVDWEGINLHIYGIWPNLGPDSPLHKFYQPHIVENTAIAKFYSSAKICLNFNRRSLVAQTPGPRVYETAACEAFQLSDPRDDMEKLFAHSIPTFKTPEELGSRIREFLGKPEARRSLALEARIRVQEQTFDHRVVSMFEVLEQSRSPVATTEAGT